MGVVHRLIALYTKCYCTVYNVHCVGRVRNTKHNAEFEHDTVPPFLWNTFPNEFDYFLRMLIVNG
jgi:hypothetical protein